MTRAGDWTPLISAANRALRLDLPRKPFAVRHKLAGDALLTLPRIAQLVSEWPRELVDHPCAKTAMSQHGHVRAAPDSAAATHEIETADGWTVLRGI